MKADELDERASRSLAESLRDEARHAPGGHHEESGGLLLCGGRGELPLPPNKVMALADLAPEEVRRRADDFFGPRRAGYSLQLRLGTVDEGLRRAAAGWGPLLEVDSAAMVLHHRLDPPAPSDPAVTLEQVTGPAGAAHYAAVVDEAYQSLGWPAGGAAELFSSPGLLLQPAKFAVVAYRADEPVAAAYVLVAEELGLVSWVGTTTAARGLGLGEAVTRSVTNAAFDLGARAAWLTASTMGEALYRRLGFAEFARARSVVLWPSLSRSGPPDG